MANRTIEQIDPTIGDIRQIMLTYDGGSLTDASVYAFVRRVGSTDTDRLVASRSGADIPAGLKSAAESFLPGALGEIRSENGFA